MGESALSLVERLRAALDRAEEIATLAARTNGARWEREWAFSTHFVVPADAQGSTAAVNVSRLKPSQRAAAEHIAANDPAVVLRTVAAHRKILDWHTADDHHCSPEPPDRDWKVYDAGEPVTLTYPCAHLRVLAAVYFPEAPDA